MQMVHACWPSQKKDGVEACATQHRPLRHGPGTTGRARPTRAVPRIPKRGAPRVQPRGSSPDDRIHGLENYLNRIQTHAQCQETGRVFGHWLTAGAFGEESRGIGGVRSTAPQPNSAPGCARMRAGEGSASCVKGWCCRSAQGEVEWFMGGLDFAESDFGPPTVFVSASEMRNS
jgi:hypothetical protein